MTDGRAQVIDRKPAGENLFSPVAGATPGPGESSPGAQHYAPGTGPDGPVGTLGTVVVNGAGQQLLVPEEELRRVDAIGAELERPTGPHCAHCGEPFPPRTGSGGRPLRFCSTACRRAGVNPQRAPTPPTPSPQNAPALPDYIERLISAPGPKSDPEFDWENDDDVVVKPSPGLAIYTNAKGHVVLTDKDGDFVTVAPEHLDAVIHRLTEWRDTLCPGAAK